MLPKGVYTMILILPVVSVIAYCFGYITTSGIIGCIAAILSVTLFFNNKWFLIAFAGITGISGAFLPQKKVLSRILCILEHLLLSLYF